MIRNTRKHLEPLGTARNCSLPLGNCGGGESTAKKGKHKKIVIKKKSGLSMPAFSKPVPPAAAIKTTQTGRKRTLDPKLTSEDNVHADAVKRRKIQQAKS